MGFAQTVIGGYAKASEYDAAKRQALIQGEAQKNAAYAKATASEQASRKQLHQVGENMERMAGNRRREAASARTAAVTAGFTLDGSANRGEEVVRRAYDDAMADMARSGSVASMNALNEQVALRRGGDAAMSAAEVEARQYRAMASATRTGAFMSAVGGAVGAVGGYYGAGKDEEWLQNATWQQRVGNGIQTGTAGAGLMAAFDPFMADLAPKDWDKYYLDMLGVGKTK